MSVTMGAPGVTRGLRAWRTLLRGSLLVLLGALLVTPSHAHYDGRSRADTPTYLTDFASLRWGASRQEVKQRLGDPDDVKPMERRLSKLPYPGWRGHRWYYENVSLHGETATMVLYMHPTEGLRKGEYRFSFLPRRDCLGMFLHLEEVLRERYPGMEPLRRRKDPASYMDYCKAVRIGAAERHVWWKDPTAPVLLHLALERNTSYVVLELEGPEWVWWRGTAFEDAILERYELN